MSDTDYGFGNTNEASVRAESRREYRLTVRAIAMLEMEASDPEGSGEGTQGRAIHCRIRDISAAGFSLYCDEPLTEGALLPVTIDLDNPVAPIGLMVEVVWCCPDEAAFLAGLHIVESDGTGYVEWVEAVASAMVDG
ncbi:PilZ domain-containing protein [Marinobacter salinexigens]|uniref:PilZ domain-containing protein n=1 Tax=Marinobacter salinexigens TaxID=2919747 RepID=A0A5B0VKC0_9GAMM|nr:PilZ domain-containing protein [Marinobacter salinexigens]KAA1175137.1 PilZ domain-containing protein [Marinobacter salinexigens]